MFLRTSRIVRSRLFRRLSLAFVLAATWEAWWIWLPQPELRVVIETSSKFPSGVVTADGRSLICEAESRNYISGVVMPPRRVEVFELPAGTHCFTLYGEHGLGVSVSPDGSHVVTSESAEEWQWQIRDLPSGQTIRRLKINSYDIDWAPDGRHVLFFGDDLSVFRAESGEWVGRFDVRRDTFTCRPDGAGFVALANDRWELLVHSFDPAIADTTVPLPGRPALQLPRGNDRPAEGSIWIEQLSTTNDGSAIFTFLDRYHRDGDEDRRRRFLARWDRSTQRWSEVDMGPVTRSASSLSALRLDTRGRYLGTTNFVPRLQAYWVYGNELGIGGEEEARQFEGRDFWDARTYPPRCLNGGGLPETPLRFDPTGRRAIGLTGVIYDPETWAALSSPVPHANFDFAPMNFSADGKYVEFSESSEPWNPSWLPGWAADKINRLLGLSGTSFRVMRLADGKTVRHLYGRTNPSLTTDGYLWTVTQKDRTDENVTLLAERWSPETPGPPWWLMMLTAGGCVLIVWDIRRGRRTKLPIKTIV